MRTWELAVRVSTPQHFSIKSRYAVVEQREQSEHGRLSGTFTSPPCAGGWSRDPRGVLKPSWRFCGRGLMDRR